MEHSNDEWKRRIKKNYFQIASNLDPKGFIVNKLFAEDIITFSQVEEINDCQDKEKRVHKLFSFLFETVHPRAFVVFREALQEDYDWIVKMIDECKDPLESHSITKQQQSKKERNSSGTNLENHPTAEKSKKSESSVYDVNQSTSTSALVKDPSVYSIISEQQLGASQQNNVLLSNNELKRKTKKFYFEIARSLDPKGFILHKLFAEDIMTHSQMEEINDCHGMEERAQKLLSFLFNSEHPKAFVVFREALQEDYGWIVKKIDECKDPLESHSITKQQQRKKERSSDKADLENHSASKKSRQSESSVNDVNQSTSTSASVKDPLVSEQQPGTSQQSSVLLQSGGHADIATISSPPIVTPAGSLTSLQALGEGGYGIVYKAQHSEWGTVAYKQLHAQLIKDRDISALKQEAEIQWKLHHPNIVQVLGIVLESRNYGIVLEFVGKGELLDYIQDNNPDLEFKLSASYDVCLAMSYLHSLSPPLIHGDLKIENILLEKNGRAKVCDFGFSKWKDYSKSHSKEKVRVGTVTHVPPELWKKPFLRKVESFDVYSYGVCLWEILAGDKPFEGAGSELIKLWVLDNQRPNLESIPNETPAQITELMKQCWDDNISSRPRFTEVKKIFEEMIR